jgi:hypothetical protein
MTVGFQKLIEGMTAGLKNKYSAQKHLLFSLENGLWKLIIQLNLFSRRREFMPKRSIFFGMETNLRNDGRPSITYTYIRILSQKFSL